MIEMWDADFCRADERVNTALQANEGAVAFELMHTQLDEVWQELERVVKTGGIVCVNIGDAARTLDGVFQLHSSHSRVISKLVSLGFQNLPNIIWRKSTNAPNKFMGSGMLPPGAYVTLEHEYILIFRKGSKRQFASKELKQLRRESAYFWEERNQWFSDVWLDLRGVRQGLNRTKLRARSAAFPFELAYRIVNMFSVKGDIVLDPFLGTGTTLCAALASERNSIGFEIDASFRQIIEERVSALKSSANEYIASRLDQHIRHIESRIVDGKPPKFMIESLGAGCVSRQECGIVLCNIEDIRRTAANTFEANYKQITTCNIQAMSNVSEAVKQSKRTVTGGQIRLDF